MALLFKSSSKHTNPPASRPPAPASPATPDISMMTPSSQPANNQPSSYTRHSRIYTQNSTRISSSPQGSSSSFSPVAALAPSTSPSLPPLPPPQFQQAHYQAQQTLTQAQAQHVQTQTFANNAGNSASPRPHQPATTTPFFQQVSSDQQNHTSSSSRRAPPLALNLGPSPTFSSNITISQQAPLTHPSSPFQSQPLPPPPSSAQNGTNSAHTPTSPSNNISIPKSMKRKNFKQLSLGPQTSTVDPPTPSSFSVSTTSSSSAYPSSISQSQSNSSSSSSSSTASSSISPSHHTISTTGNGTTLVQLVSSGTQSVSRTRQNPDSLIPQMSSLELGVEFHLDMCKDDFSLISELGSGNGGTVAKVRHIPTNKIMARKKIPIEPKPEVRRRIDKEIVIMRECNSPYIVSFYGSFISDNYVVMCMEYMDKGSLDYISKKKGPLPEPIIGKITVAVVEGLVYLYESYHIMHRDIKPSNVLVNSKGQIKLCDFGVSSELVNSMADTFVGTSTYMSPERIRGGQYNVRSDVWSLGITLLELAIGYFPWGNGPRWASSRRDSRYGDDGGDDDDDDDSDDGNGAGVNRPCGILDLLHRIVNEAPPTLPPDAPFSDYFRKFINNCLAKESERPTPKELKNDDFFILSKRNNVRLDLWAQQL